MSLRESLSRVEARIRRVADPVLRAALAEELRVLCCFMGNNLAETILTQSFALFEQLERHERANAAPEIRPRRNRITPQQAAEAVRIHGGVRAAARMLQVSHMTVMRKIRLAHVPMTTSGTSAAAR